MDRFFPVDEQVLDAVIDWSYRRIVGGEDPMTGARPASELDAELDGSICPEGIGGPEALRRFTQVIVPATRAQGHPMNLAYVPASPTAAALTFDLAVSAAQIFGGIWEAGAGAICAENQALRWLADLAGWPATAGGTFVQGGTIGNLSALATARQRAEQRRGGRPPRWRLAATSAAHSSITAAARVMDVDVCWVPGDSEGRLTGSALEAILAEDGADVFAVVANVGATNAGLVDDLAGIAEVCGRRDVWLHVDGAYGLAGMAAPSLRRRFGGIETADSFVVDPHKWLFAPYDSCALVYREPEHAAAAHAQFASYLEQIDRDEWNPSDYAIQLSRRVRGLPLWFSLATYGTDAYAAAVEQVVATTDAVVAGIRAADHLELVLEPDLTVVLFRRPGWTPEQMRAWSDAQARLGTVLVVPTRWHDESVFRLCFVNPRTRAERVLRVLDTLADDPPPGG
jgi:glutamate/tyrosine decarboxylase-like PLP-dependent enzyme